MYQNPPRRPKVSMPTFYRTAPQTSQRDASHHRSCHSIPCSRKLSLRLIRMVGRAVPAAASFALSGVVPCSRPARRGAAMLVPTLDCGDSSPLAVVVRVPLCPFSASSHSCSLHIQRNPKQESRIELWKLFFESPKNAENRMIISRNDSSYRKAPYW